MSTVTMSRSRSSSRAALLMAAVEELAPAPIRTPVVDVIGELERRYPKLFEPRRRGRSPVPASPVRPKGVRRSPWSNPAADVARWALDRALYAAQDAFVHPPGVQVGGSWVLQEYWPDLFGAPTEPETGLGHPVRFRARDPALLVPVQQIEPTPQLPYLTTAGQYWTGGILVPQGYAMGVRYYRYDGAFPMPAEERPGYVGPHPQPLPVSIAQPAPPVRSWGAARAAAATASALANPVARVGAYSETAAKVGSATGVAPDTAPAAKADPLLRIIGGLSATQRRYRGPEQKLRMPAYKAWLVTKLVEGATEGADFVSAIHAALPPSVQRECKRKFGAVRNKTDEVTMKVQCIAANIAALDPEGVVRELAAEAIQDALIGAADQLRSRAMGTVMRRSLGEMQALKGDAGRNVGGDWATPFIDAVVDAIRDREARYARQAAQGY